MKDLRERCADTLSGIVGRMNRPSEGNPLDLLESFAREIRNEALEEAAKLFDGTDLVHMHVAASIRALAAKTEGET